MSEKTNENLQKKSITIYCGDEYRAKLERKDVPSDDVFDKIYCAAAELVNEISSEMDRFVEETKEVSSYKSKYWGMGNNIIVFCGRRGQGKTSAMLSFVKILSGDINREKCILENKGKYMVLDSIDPSALENKETIVRVVLSRLFYRIKKYFDDKGNSGNEKLYRLQEQKITELLQKCYTDIDYLKMGKTNDWELEDLEAIAQMGSSMELKENLYNLVKEFLEMTCKSEDKKQYLVIPIDDADLATKKVFEICEDVRNYLSIPNVIVLMAADIQRLEYAIYQGFLKNYEHLVKLQKKIAMSDECHRMAMRYMEKTFPVRHRIELPGFELIIQRDLEKLTVKYRKEDKDIIEEETKNCANMQEQLLLLIYNRTGIVFLNDRNELHCFLPRRMRELTHFMKLLQTMKPIYGKDMETSGFAEMAEYDKLLENLATLREYFTEQWCTKNLDAAQIELMRKIATVQRNNNYIVVLRLIRQYCDNRIKEEDDIFSEEQMTYHKLIYEVLDKWLAGETMLRKAIQIYYTIFLNEYFICGQKENDFSKFIQFIGEPFQLPGECFNNKYKGKYNVTRFDIERKELVELFGEDKLTGGATYNWLRCFCKAVVQDSDKKKERQYGELFWELDNDNKKLNPKADKLEVDVLRPIMTMLNSELWEGDSSSSKARTSSDEDTGETTALGVYSEISKKYLPIARIILTNYDVQEYVRQNLITYYGQLPILEEKRTWTELCLKIYETIDSWEEKANFLDEKDKAYGTREFCQTVMTDAEILYGTFLLNKENAVKLQEEYKATVVNYITDIKNTVENPNKDEVINNLRDINNEYKETVLAMVPKKIVDNLRDDKHPDKCLQESEKRLADGLKAVLNCGNKEDMENEIQTRIASLKEIANAEYGRVRYKKGQSVIENKKQISSKQDKNRQRGGQGRKKRWKDSK